MDKHCFYIESVGKQNKVMSNGSVFFITHDAKNYLLTAAHTLRTYNDFIFSDFSNWHAEYIKLGDAKIALYNTTHHRVPLFKYFEKDSKELLDVIALPCQQRGGPVDVNAKVNDKINLCGWRSLSVPTKFILEGTIQSIDKWDIVIDLSKHSKMERSGISGGGVYTSQGFVGVYFADDIGKDTAHAVSIKYMLEN